MNGQQIRKSNASGGKRVCAIGASLFATLGTLGYLLHQPEEQPLVENVIVENSIPDGEYIPAGAFSVAENAERVIKSLEDALEELGCEGCEVYTEDVVFNAKNFRRVLVSYQENDFDDIMRLAKRSADIDYVISKKNGEDSYTALETEIAEQFEMLATTLSKGYDSRFESYQDILYAQIDSQTGLTGFEREMFHDLMYVVTERESTFRPRAIGGAGEIGLTQIKPWTARGVDRNRGTGQKTNEQYRNILMNPDSNYEYGVWLMNDARRYWSDKLGKEWTHPDVIKMMFADHNQGRSGAKTYYKKQSARNYVDENVKALAMLYEN